MSLADQQCVPCRGGVPPLGRPEAESLLAQLAAGWRINEAGHLERTFEYQNFKQALDFAVEVGQIAERQRHHPDLHIGWGRCRVEIWTHKIDGLTESDFYLAAKVDRAAGG